MTFGKPEIHELFEKYLRQIYERFAEARDCDEKA